MLASNDCWETARSGVYSLNTPFNQLPNGLAQAFIIGEDFIGSDDVALVLGDNIFYGDALDDSLQKCTSPDGGIVFACEVSDPERYGVVEFDANQKAMSIEKKASRTKI